jgi:hypothetical protein
MIGNSNGGVVVSRTRCSVQRCSAEPGPIRSVWTPDQQRTTPQGRRVAQHPGHDRRGIHPSSCKRFSKKLEVKPGDDDPRIGNPHAPVA